MSESAGERFAGLTHEQVLERTVPETVQLVDGLVEKGSVGTIAGLPESHKSFLAMEIAIKVAANRGAVLGEFPVVDGGCHVSYWWQDDSEANELRRIQEYSIRNGFKTGVDLTWHLNESLRIDTDEGLGELEREAHGAGLIVLDSLYNFLGARVLKEEDVAVVFTAVKARVCDQLDATVMIGDHAPWPTDANKGQRRAYGSVFKAAAIRWGIYLARDGDKLWIEARGNNLAGFPKRLAAFDADRLELRLLEIETPESRDIAGEIEAFLAEHPGASTVEVVEGVRANKKRTTDILKSNGRFVRVQPPPGKPGNAHCWCLGTPPKPLFSDNGNSGEQVGAGDAPPAIPEPLSPPVGGWGSGNGDGDPCSDLPDEFEIERLAIEAQELGL